MEFVAGENELTPGEDHRDHQASCLIVSSVVNPQAHGNSPNK